MDVLFVQNNQTEEEGIDFSNVHETLVYGVFYWLLSE